MRLRMSFYLSLCIVLRGIVEMTCCSPTSRRRSSLRHTKWLQTSRGNPRWRAGCCRRRRSPPRTRPYADRVRSVRHCRSRAALMGPCPDVLALALRHRQSLPDLAGAAWLDGSRPGSFPHRSRSRRTLPSPASRHAGDRRLLTPGISGHQRRQGMCRQSPRCRA